MFKLFSRLFEEQKQMQDNVEATHTTICEEPAEPEEPSYVEKWREPVQSLICSLEEGWWDYKSMDYTYSTSFYFKHEWLQTTFTLRCTYNDRGAKGTSWSVQEDWLTKDENTAVTEAAKSAMQALDKKKENRRNDLREQEFFKLVELKENLNDLRSETGNNHSTRSKCE